MEKIIYQVDAFADRPFGGNPAGVVPDSRGLSEKEMQKIAREMNLSETAFVTALRDEEADFHVRFFTPEQEVDLCGHATIAAFYVMTKKGYIEVNGGKKVITQKTKAGTLPVEIEIAQTDQIHVMMTQAKPMFGEQIKDIGVLAEIMGTKEDEIGISGKTILPQIVSTGLHDIIMPVVSLKALKRIKPDMERLALYSKQMGVIGVHAFTLEKEEDASYLSARNFAPACGIDEEAATGTSNGALGAYLVNNNIIALEKEATILCEQGYYMGRPSKIMVKLIGDKENYCVRVGGTAFITLEGVIVYS
ncbi:MAG: PhzF family phenazine biosynthesis protein [Bacillota bacterium]